MRKAQVQSANSKKNRREGIHKNTQGFSLIEVIVALAIVAVSLGAIIHSVGTTASNEAAIGEKTFARWVAMNQIAKAKLERAWPKIGDSSGNEEMAGANWIWKQKTISAADEDLRKIEISVWREGHEKDAPDAFMSGYLTRQ